LLDWALETRTTSIQECWREGFLGFLQACFVIEPLASSWRYLEAGSHNAVPKALRFSCGSLSTSNHPTALASQVAWITGESQISRPKSLISRPNNIFFIFKDLLQNSRFFQDFPRHLKSYSKFCKSHNFMYCMPLFTS
jgi:hypothetical protein